MFYVVFQECNWKGAVGFQTGQRKKYCWDMLMSEIFIMCTIAHLEHFR